MEKSSSDRDQQLKDVLHLMILLPVSTHSWQNCQSLQQVLQKTLLFKQSEVEDNFVLEEWKVVPCTVRIPKIKGPMK